MENNGGTRSDVLLISFRFWHVLAMTVISGMLTLMALVVRFSKRGTTSRHVTFPKISFQASMTNVALWPLKRLRVGKFKPLSLEDLKREAIKKEHGYDFGKYEEPLQFTIDRINNNYSRISPMGYILTRELFIRRLRVKLRIAAEFKLKNFQEYCQKFPVKEPIFIIGMPRTGTTYLHRLLSLDRFSRAPFTWELFDPSRRVLDDPTKDMEKRIKFCQKSIDFLISLAPHIEQIHPMAADFPEECLMALGLDVPLLFDTFHLFLESPETAYEWDCTEVYKNYFKILQMLQYQDFIREGYSSPERRWVLKCPLHLGLLDFLSKAFPDAKFIWTHRNLNDAVPSLARLIRVGMDMTVNGSIDLRALGQNCVAFLQQWLQRGDNFFCTNEKRESRHPVAHVMYNNLIHNPKQTILKIYHDLDLSFTTDYEQALEDHLDNKGKNHVKSRAGITFSSPSKYPTGYSLEEYFLSESMIHNKLGWYIRKYIPVE